MFYYKITKNDEIVGVDAFYKPKYVYRQPSNGVVIICPKIKAQGIVSSDGTTIYQLADRDDIGIADAPVATRIYEPEYVSLKLDLENE